MIDDRVMGRTIWFFKYGSFSQVNRQVESQLRRVFSDHELCVVDIRENILRPAGAGAWPLLLGAAMRNWRLVLGNRRNPADFVFELPATWRMIARWVERNVPLETTAFVFQTQSLFSAARTGRPMFLYTDHTRAAHARYAVRGRLKKVSRAWAALEHSLYHEAACNFTTSEFAAKSIVEDYGVSRGRVCCVYSGINIPFPVEDARRKAERPVILFMGYGWERKGGKYLLGAFEEVRRVVPDAELWLVGSSPGREIPGVRVFGSVTPKVTEELYAQASVFCLPSLQEPSASVLIEAASFGVPVVATDVGATPERVLHGKTGLIVPPAQVKPLAEALIRMLTRKEEAEKFGIAGREYIRERFMWDVVGEKIGTRIREELERR